MARTFGKLRVGRILAAPLPALAILALGTAASAEPALPAGGTVVAGSATIGAPTGSSLTVTQSSTRAIVDWSGFSVGQGGSVRFDNGTGATLNRVTGASVSTIDGTLSASGSVYLINPNGVVIGTGGVVDVGGSFVATTLGIDDDAFMGGGELGFAGGSGAAVINLGKIGALGGDVALIATRVENRGTITAANGTAGLLAGTDVLLRDAALDGGRFVVRVGGAGTSATNAGTIAAAAAELRANGGNVYALAGDTGGAISAQGVSARDGRIFLTAGDTGSVQVAGTLTARGPGGTGGAIETSGGRVEVGAASIDAGIGGSWLLDPVDIVIDQPAATTIAATLNAGTNVTQSTSAAGMGGMGDISVSPDVAIGWRTNAALTLSAYRSIVIGAGATLTSTGGGAVTLYADNTGIGTGAVTFGTGAMVSTAGAVEVFYNGTQNAVVTGGGTLTAYQLVNSISDLQAISDNGSYALGRDIDNAGHPFTPIGGSRPGRGPDCFYCEPGTPFTGLFDGRGHAIANLAITVDAIYGTYAGLFGWIGAGATVRNLNLVGGIVAVTPLRIAGVVPNPELGAIAGHNTGATISNVSSSVTISGLGAYHVGGLIGNNVSGTITNSYVSGSVTGQSYYFTYYYGRCNCIPAGGGIGNQDTGGITGFNGGTITNSYVTGAVSGNGSYAGGLAGYNTGTIDGGYVSGKVSDAGMIGGLVGTNASGATLTNGYWDEGTTRQLLAYGTNQGIVTRLVGIGGDTTYSPYAQSTYTHFTYGPGGTWVMLEGQTRPFLASEYSTNITNAHQLQLVALHPDASYTVGTSFSAAETDGASNPSGMWTAAGFVPIGTAAAPFTGTFDGTGKTIAGLFVDRPTTDSVGLFGSANGTVSNVTLSAPRITGQFNVGAVAGSAGGSIADVAVTGGAITGTSAGGVVGTAAGSLRDIVASANIVTARDGAGGVAGNSSAFITSAVVTGGSVTGGDGVGGIAGGTTSSIGDSTSSAAVTGHNYVGGLVGYIGHSEQGTSTSTIYRSSASGTVRGSTDVGGLIGYSEASVESSFASGTVTAGDNAQGVGGLIGFANVFPNARLADVYATGAVTTGQLSRYVGGLIGVVARGPNGRPGGFVSNAYATGAVTTGSLAGEVGGLVGSDAGVPMTNAYWDIGSTGRTIGVGSGLAAGSSVTGIGSTTGISPYAQATYTGFDLGGTWVIFDGLTRPILRSEYSLNITNAHQLQLIALDPYVDYTLVRDLDLSVTAALPDVWNTATGFVPIASGGLFTGALDGGGHALANLTITRPTTDGVGLFAGLGNSGAVRNLTLTGVAVTGATNVGGIAGASSGTIANVTLTGAVTGANSVGGLLGYNLGTVGGSGVAITVNATNFAGGLVGYNAGALSGSATGVVASSGSYAGGITGYDDQQATLTGTFSGTVTAHDYAGGVAGFNSGTIRASNGVANLSVAATRGAGGLVGFNTGNITGSSAEAVVYALDLAGGFVGVNFGAIADQRTTSNVSGGTQLGGFAGANASGGTLTNVSAGGSVTGTGTLGGLVGYNDGAIVTSYATGAVGGAGANFAGGLVGYNARSIAGSYATGNVTGGTFVGGLAGYSDRLGTIANSAAYSQVSGADYAGGLAGFNSGVIADSQTNSVVSASGRGAGGLVAYNTGTITRAFANGSVASPALSGGLVGLNFGTVSLSYANAAASGTDSVGGLVGANVGTLAKVYATGAVSGSTEVGGLAGYSRGSVTDVYATGAVTGGDAGTTGGLVGFADAQSAIRRGYASGAVARGGGVAGTNSGTLGAVFYDAGTTGTAQAVFSGSAIGTTAVGGTTGRSAYAQASYPGLDFLDVWTIQQGQSRPTLQDNPQNPAPN